MRATAGSGSAEPRPILRGALLGAMAGAVGGAAFGAAMASVGSLASIALLVRAHTFIVALVLHMLIAVVIGAGFGVLVARQRPGAGEMLFWGLTYGAFWWFLGALTLLPLLTGQPLAWHLAAAQDGVPSLLGHLLYGAVTALALVALRGFRDPSQTRLTAKGILRGAIAGVVAALGLAAALGAGLEPAGALAAPFGLPRALATLLTGVIFGAGYSLLKPDGSSGAGPGLVRGTCYGFAWWALGHLTLVPFLSGHGLAWSLPAVRARFPALPGLVLMGAATAVLWIWLDGSARGLFDDRARRQDEEGAGTRGLRALGRGVLAGLGGGLVFTALMVQIGYLPTVARIAGSKSQVTGLVLHLLISVFIGASYGLLFRRRSYDIGSALGWGVCYGFFWWVLGGITLLPVFLGGSPAWDAVRVAATFPSLVGHIAYGAALGVVYFRLETRVSPWWVARTEAEAERARLRRQETLTAAPALWSLTVLAALTVPLLVGR